MSQSINIFLTFFEIASKEHYAKIILHHVDQYYLKLPEQLLQIFQCNFTVPLYDGKSKAGVPLENWSIDGTIEMLQKHYHSLNFHDDKGVWKEQSGCISLDYCSVLFHTQEYQRDYLHLEYEKDNNPDTEQRK